MKIVIGADTYYPNVDGASYFTQHLAVELTKRGHEILVIAPSTTSVSGYSEHDDVRIFGISSLPTFFHKDFRFVPPFFIRSKIKKAIREFAPALVHIQGHFFVESTCAKVARELKIPVMGTNHFMPENLIHYLHMPSFIETIIKWFAWKQFCHVFDQLPIVTTPTQRAADVLRQIGCRKIAIPVSCGIDLAKFHALNNSEQLKKRYRLPDKPIMLSVGRLAPEKNLDQVMKAFAKANQHKSLHFFIAGSGMEKKKLEKLTVDLEITDCVTFGGFVPDEDLPSLYSMASFFVNAGTVELQSLVTMEAMASGLPVIAVNALALPELVHDGENGYLFEPKDIETLADRINKLAASQELRQRMSMKSLEIIQKHDIHKTIGQFEELYKKLLQK